MTENVISDKFEVIEIKEEEPKKIQKEEAETKTAGKSKSGTQESSADYISQLTQLGNLRDNGIISDAEFERGKQKILDLMDRL